MKSSKNLKTSKVIVEVVRLTPQDRVQMRCCTPSRDVHVPGLAPLCASQPVKDGTMAVIQERDAKGFQQQHQCPVWTVVWQGTSLSSASFRVTLWRDWWLHPDEAVNALSEIDLKIDQATSMCTRRQDAEWYHKAVSHKKNIGGEASDGGIR